MAERAWVWAVMEDGRWQMKGTWPGSISSASGNRAKREENNGAGQCVCVCVWIESIERSFGIGGNQASLPTVCKCCLLTSYEGWMTSSEWTEMVDFNWVTRMPQAIQSQHAPAALQLHCTVSSVNVACPHVSTPLCLALSCLVFGLSCLVSSFFRASGRLCSYASSLSRSANLT